MTPITSLQGCAMTLITKAQLAKLAANGRRQAAVKGTPDEIDFQPVVKLFDPCGAGTWLLTEIEPDDHDIAWGLCDLGMGTPEFGTVSLKELATMRFGIGMNGRMTGGVLGIEEHRAKSTGLQDPQAGDGYVQEEFVKLLAEDAGFKFAGSSEINANPKDTKDHPFGVWTLPPILRTAPLGMAPDSGFDTSKYQEIGESDRMTLKFIKPTEPPDPAQ